MDKKDVTFHISVGSVVTVVVVLLAFGLLFYLKNLALVVLTAIVFASAIEPAVLFFKKYHIPRVLGVIFTYLIVFGFLAAVFAFLFPPILDEAGGFLQSLPEVASEIDIADSSFFGAGQVVNSLSLQDAILDLQSNLTTTTEGLFASISTIFGGLFSFLLVVLLSFYFAVREQGIDDFLRVVTPLKHEDYVLDLWKRSQRKIGLWIQGQLVLSLIIFILLYLGLSILQVPYALLLAIFAALLELIPVFGSLVAAVPGVAVAFVSGGATLGLIVLGLYIIVNQFQGNLIYPLVVKKIVGVPPLLVILSMIVGAQLAGFLGIILSVPIVATLQEFLSDIDKKKRAAKKS